MRFIIKVRLTMGVLDLPNFSVDIVKLHHEYNHLYSFLQTPV